MKRRKIYIIIAIVLLLLWYLYNNYFMIYFANNHIDVGGVKLGQPLKEVQQIMGSSGEELGFGRAYKFEGLEIGISKSSGIEERVYYIAALDPKYQIYDVRVGDSYKEAEEKLLKAGFKEKGANYNKGCINIQFTGKNQHVYEILIRAFDRISLNFLFGIKAD